MNDEITIELDRHALEAVPIFPLPGTVLLPHTLLSLHIFEPRYRQMMAHCVATHRVMAIAMLQEEGGQPDEHGRPPVYPMAGLGYIRRSARLPDGRYNTVIQGIGRIDIGHEHPPHQAFRRARAQLFEDPVLTTEDSETLAAGHALRALSTRLLDHSGGDELLSGLCHLEPGRLADTIAATIIDDTQERQHILETTNVFKRIQLVSGIIGAMLIEKEAEERVLSVTDSNLPGWGTVTGKA